MSARLTAPAPWRSASTHAICSISPARSKARKCASCFRTRVRPPSSKTRRTREPSTSLCHSGSDLTEFDRHESSSLPLREGAREGEAFARGRGTAAQSPSPEAPSASHPLPRPLPQEEGEKRLAVTRLQLTNFRS